MKNCDGNGTNKQKLTWWNHVELLYIDYNNRDTDDGCTIDADKNSFSILLGLFNLFLIIFGILAGVVYAYPLCYGNVPLLWLFTPVFFTLCYIVIFILKKWVLEKLGLDDVLDNLPTKVIFNVAESYLAKKWNNINDCNIILLIKCIKEVYKYFPKLGFHLYWSFFWASSLVASALIVMFDEPDSYDWSTVYRTKKMHCVVSTLPCRMLWSEKPKFEDLAYIDAKENDTRNPIEESIAVSQKNCEAQAYYYPLEDSSEKRTPFSIKKSDKVKIVFSDEKESSQSRIFLKKGSKYNRIESSGFTANELLDYPELVVCQADCDTPNETCLRYIPGYEATDLKYMPENHTERIFWFGFFIIFYYGLLPRLLFLIITVIQLFIYKKNLVKKYLYLKKFSPDIKVFAPTTGSFLPGSTESLPPAKYMRSENKNDKQYHEQMVIFYLKRPDKSILKIIGANENQMYPDHISEGEVNQQELLDALTASPPKIHVCVEENRTPDGSTREFLTRVHKKSQHSEITLWLLPSSPDQNSKRDTHTSRWCKGLEKLSFINIKRLELIKDL